MSQLEHDRFQTFINHIGAQPTLMGRVKMTFDGLVQLLRERADAASKTGANGAHMAPFADLTNILDKHQGALQSALVSGSPVVAAGSSQLFPGDVGYVIDQPLVGPGAEGHHALHDLWVVVPPNQPWDPAKSADVYTEAAANAVVAANPDGGKAVRLMDAFGDRRFEAGDARREVPYQQPDVQKVTTSPPTPRLNQSDAQRAGVTQAQWDALTDADRAFRRATFPAAPHQATDMTEALNAAQQAERRAASSPTHPV